MFNDGSSLWLLKSSRQGYTNNNKTINFRLTYLQQKLRSSICSSFQLIIFNVPFMWLFCNLQVCRLTVLTATDLEFWRRQCFRSYGLGVSKLEFGPHCIQSCNYILWTCRCYCPQGICIASLSSKPVWTWTKPGHNQEPMQNACNRPLILQNAVG